jgi:hypothetical protein
MMGRFNPLPMTVEVNMSRSLSFMSLALMACYGGQPETITRTVTNTVYETITVPAPGDDTAPPTDTGADTDVPSTDTGYTVPPNPEADDDSDGWTIGAGDCDDSNGDTFPGAAEIEDPVACMNDGDLDGWGDDGHTGTIPAGVALGTDCDDGWIYNFPGAGEHSCDDGSDNDCDGFTDAADPECA